MNISRREFFAASASAAIWTTDSTPRPVETRIGIPFWIVDSTGANWETLGPNPSRDILFFGGEDLVWFSSKKSDPSDFSCEMDWVTVR